MLTLSAPQAETLWDELLPVEARELPEDLAKLDELLGDPALLLPIAAHWRRAGEQRGRLAEALGRPTIAMETYVRLMLITQRSGFGYETLVREAACPHCDRLSQSLAFARQRAHPVGGQAGVGRLAHIRLDDRRVDPHRARPKAVLGDCLLDQTARQLRDDLGAEPACQLAQGRPVSAACARVRHQSCARPKGSSG